MSVKPFWITPAGSLGTFEQGVLIPPIALDAANTTSIELISKNLPTGLKLDTITKVITGIPLDPGITKSYEFVLRAINTTGVNNTQVIQDRTFSITIKSELAPTLLNPAGVLKLGLTNENYILNKSTVNYQFTATANSIPVGQSLKFYIEEGQGQLPPGLKFTETGLLYGTVDDDLELDYTRVQGSYDKDYYDINPYDYGSKIENAQVRTTLNSGKISKVDIIYGGDGYLLDPEVIVGGSVDQVAIVSGGSGYSIPPKVVFSTSPISGGITAQGVAVLTNSSVGSVIVTNPGTGYSVPPTIYFQDQNTGMGASAVCSLRAGSGAEFVARVSNGSVRQVEIVNPGGGYLQPPLLSFSLPTAGARIISKTYKFTVTVSTGAATDSKEYTIIVKSEDSLRADTTFILSDSIEFDSSRTYIQPPIWLGSPTLPIIKGDNNFSYSLEVFDPTPTVGKLYFSLMDDNFDSTRSELGPEDVEKNRTEYSIIQLFLTNPVRIEINTPKIFKDSDRVRISGIVGTSELNGNAYYLSKIDETNYELYFDENLATSVDGTSFTPYVSGGTLNFQNYYLQLDMLSGEIYGFIPYQPAVTKTYNFTIKVARLVDGLEVSNAFRQFELTIKGNIQGQITFTSPRLIGSLKPNELSLLRIEATSTIPAASVNYQLIPGYGSTSSVNYIELNLKESQGKILVDGYGINPVIILEKGQSYKINVSLNNFTVSFRNPDGSYYNSNLKHSTGSFGIPAQEKNSGYYIFLPPYDSTTRINIRYTNTKKDGLYLAVKKYDDITEKWNRIFVGAYFSTYDAYVNNYKDISSGNDVFATILNYTKIQFTIRKYNPNTLQWDAVDIPTIKPFDTVNNPYWLDLTESNFGVLDFRYFGLRGVWTKVTAPVSNALKTNSEGSNGDYYILNSAGTFSTYRKIQGTWKLLQILPFGVKTVNDPNVFITNHYASTPATNLQFDVWFKYTSLYDGYDQSIDVTLKSLDNLPTDISVGLGGDVIGKISPNTGNSYKGYYSDNVLYVVNDVVEYDKTLYICQNQYRSSGRWFSELSNWKQFFYTKRITTSIDVNEYGIGKFSIAGPRGDDGTTIDKLLRFRVRAKDSQNVSFSDKDFNIDYQALTNITLTNIYLQPFLNKNSRDTFFNFITDPTIFPQESLYRAEDPSFGLQRLPRMLLVGGIENTTAERYASAVQRNYYDRPLYFSDVKAAIAEIDGEIVYEVLYVEIKDPYETNGVSISKQIKLPFDFDPLTIDYSKIRMDQIDVVISDTGLDTIYPSSVTLMQENLKDVTLEKTESVLVIPDYDFGNGGWGLIPTFQTSGPEQGNYIDTDPVTETDDWGLVNERISLVEDFLSTTLPLLTDENYLPLWMNTSQDATGNPIGYVKAIPICYVKPGESAKILALIEKSNFDFKALNFTIDRVIIQTPTGETGDKYIKFANREII